MLHMHITPKWLFVYDNNNDDYDDDHHDDHDHDHDGDWDDDDGYMYNKVCTS